MGMEGEEMLYVEKRIKNTAICSSPKGPLKTVLTGACGGSFTCTCKSKSQIGTVRKYEQHADGFETKPKCCMCEQEPCLLILLNSYRARGCRVLFLQQDSSFHVLCRS